MTGTPTIPCSCCGGAGMVGADGRGRSEAALLRAELVRVWGVAGSLERLAADIYETAGAAISSMAADLGDARDGMDERDRRISDLERQLAVHEGWGRKDGQTGNQTGDRKDGNAPQETMTRAEYRLASDVFEAARNGGEPGSIKKRKSGAQPNHRGRASSDRPGQTIPFRPDMCRCCGRTDLETVSVIRKRVLDLAGARRKTTLSMYVIRTGRCPGCGAETSPHTDAVPGTSLGPRLRATLQAYERAHNTEQDMRVMLAEIEGVHLSTGTISNCITAMAGHLDGDVLSIPGEEPVVPDPPDLRGYRCPVAPPTDIPDTEYHRQDAVLTRRSNLWTSLQPQPAIVRIAERASMDPRVRTDETGHRVGPDGVQASVAETVHTVQVRVIPRRNAATLRSIWGWSEDRPAMRDGTAGYEWHRGDPSRCNVHLLRDAEESSMENDLGSPPQYDRHRMMLAVYRDANLARLQVERLAGGPLRCAAIWGSSTACPAYLSWPMPGLPV